MVDESHQIIDSVNVGQKKEKNRAKKRVKRKKKNKKGDNKRDNNDKK